MDDTPADSPAELGVTLGRVRVIETPSDFEKTLGAEAHQVHKIVDPLPEFEADIRHAIDGVFQDLQYISTDEPELVSAYLDGIDEPLAALRGFGLQIVSQTVEGKLVIPAGAGPVPSEEERSMPWSVAHYFVATRPCFFREQGADHVHVLGVDCEGRKALIREGAAIRYWGNREVVEQAFEGTVPWCDTCFLHLPT